MAAFAFVLAQLGCPPSHLPVRTTEHLSLPWARTFDDAVAEARRSNRPVLACLIAGQIDGLC
jgi:hypothetical protein